MYFTSIFNNNENNDYYALSCPIIQSIINKNNDLENLLQLKLGIEATGKDLSKYYRMIASIRL